MGRAVVASGPAASGVAGVPVTPDAEEARRWATEELSRGIYSERRNLVEEAIAWFLDLLEQLAGLGSRSPGWLVPVLVVTVTAAAVVVALAVTGPVRRRRAGTRAAPVFEDDVRTADELRAAADAASAAGDHATAVLERFRAIIRSLGERAIVDDRPGLTAHESAVTGGGRLPEHARDLAAAADLFDGARYGHRQVTAAQDAWLRGVDLATQRARPVLLAAGAEQDR